MSDEVDVVPGHELLQDIRAEPAVLGAVKARVLEGVDQHLARGSAVVRVRSRVPVDVGAIGTRCHNDVSPYRRTEP